jgi:pyruvate/2-oxoglutarate/acetoin dehydrogenase E1 component
VIIMGEDVGYFGGVFVLTTCSLQGKIPATQTGVPAC